MQQIMSEEMESNSRSVRRECYIINLGLTVRLLCNSGEQFLSSNVF